MNSNNHITFDELYRTDFNLTDIFVVRQKWTAGALFRMSAPRKMNGLIFLNNCKGIYTNRQNESFEANRKSIVCLPYGSEYTCLNTECTNTFDDAILVQFNVTKDNKFLTFADEPFLVQDANAILAAQLFDDAVKIYETSIQSPPEIKMAIYNLLLHICREKNKKHNERFSVISKGIELIESNPLLDISIEDISRACNVSPCYFRRLFREYSSKSPLEYRMELRMTMAKKMLESGEFSIEHISEALNFESASYFCRIFKKRFGITPGQYRNKMIKFDL